MLPQSTNPLMTCRCLVEWLTRRDFVLVNGGGVGSNRGGGAIFAEVGSRGRRARREIKTNTRKAKQTRTKPNQTEQARKREIGKPKQHAHKPKQATTKAKATQGKGKARSVELEIEKAGLPNSTLRAVDFDFAHAW